MSNKKILLIISLLGFAFSIVVMLLKPSWQAFVVNIGMVIILFTLLSFDDDTIG